MEMNPTNANTSPTQNPDTDTETPPQTRPFKSLSFTNGSLKPHQRHPTVPLQPPRPPLTAVSYKECLKNHAASMGGLALDGCGEFLTSPTATHSDPTSLKCAACGCHRNFHRRDADDLMIPKALNVQHLSSSSQSPSPVCSPPPVSHIPPSQYYFSSVPQTLLSLSTASPRQYDEQYHRNSHPAVMGTENPLGRKRIRTKFTQEQKEKMFLFCEKLGWKMPKSNEMAVEEFCNEVGVDRRVLKVWMHNNKNPLRKREMGFAHNNGNGNGDRVSFETSPFSCKKESEYINGGGSVNLHVSANGSSSSS